MNFHNMEIPEAKPKRRIVRRHGACDPCRLSKIKCDGDRPCSTCRGAKRKPKACSYRNKAEEARSRKVQAIDSKPLEKSGDRHAGDTDQSETEANHSDHATLRNTPQSAIPDSLVDFRKMCRPIPLVEIVEEYSKLVAFPKSAQSVAVVSLIRKCARTLVLHIQSSRKSAETLPQIYNPVFKVEGSDRSIDPSSMVNLWNDHLALLRGLIDDGKLSFAREAVLPFRNTIKSLFEAQTDQDKLELHTAATTILAELLELEHKLDMFLGCNPIFKWTKGSGFLGSTADQIREEYQHQFKRIEMLEILEAAVKINVPDNTHLFEFVEQCFTFGQEKCRSPSLCVTPWDFTDKSTENQELKFFSSLFLTMLYCRTAGVESLCQTQKPEPGRILRNDKSKARGLSKSQKGIAGGRFDERQLVIVHANHALTAFRRLCEIDRHSTARNWFRIHGALLALLLIGLAYVQKERRVLTVSNLAETLCATCGCFKGLQELSPNNFLIQQAVAICDELSQYQEMRLKRLQFRAPVETQSHEMTSQPEFALPMDPCQPTTDVDMSTIEYSTSMLAAQEYRHIGPPYEYWMRELHPPLAMDPVQYPPRIFVTRHQLATGEAWYMPPARADGMQYMVEPVSAHPTDHPPQEHLIYSASTEMPRHSTLAEDFERDTAAATHMHMKQQAQSYQHNDSSEFEAPSTGPLNPNARDLLVASWQATYPSQNPVTESRYQEFHTQDVLEYQNPETVYHHASRMGLQTEEWPRQAHESYPYLQQNMVQGTAASW